jgi:adenylosuccinate lyase
MSAWEQQRDFQATLLAHPQLVGVLDAQALGEWLNPEQYIGSVNEKINEVMALAHQAGLFLDEPEG